MSHPASTRHKTGNSNATVGAEADHYDSVYLGEVTVGQDTLMLDLDTESSNFCIFSTATLRIRDYTHALYDANTANRVADETWEIQYGDGSAAQGVVYTDTLAMGGMSIPNLPVEVGTNASNSLLQGSPDGIMGLSYLGGGNEGKPLPCRHLLDSMIGVQQMEPIFPADLQPGGGSYDSGIINSSKYIDDITYTPVLANRPAFWDFEASSYSIGGHNVGQAEQNGYSSVDTGTSLWYLPESATKAFYGSMPSA